VRVLPLLLLAGCASSASDGVVLRGEPLSSLPDAWLSWRLEPSQILNVGGGVLIYADGRAEAAFREPAFNSSGMTTRRGRGTVSASQRAEIEKALAGDLAPPVRPPRLSDQGFRPEVEGGGRYHVEVRGPDGAVRRLSYEHRVWYEGESGGEPLHPLMQRLLVALAR
jgi:hypothetical protein